MKELVFSPLAAADIEAIWDYSADMWGLDQADSYTDALRDVCRDLADGTKQGRPSVVLSVQKYLCGSHVVYYQELADQLRVVRVSHQRQDAERHLGA